MLKGVVIVESPAKAKMLSAFLGSDYKVIASYGHTRDLVPKAGSIDTENHYKMLWEFNERGKKQITEIENALKLSDALYLATDPDREGEAISWHILEAMGARLAQKKVQRVVFHEITKSAVLHAFETPKELDRHLVDAYLARRALDYLVGFSLSPILWRKMPGARSAGRVQSVALRLIVERELEIQAFKPEEYWTMHGEFEAADGKFSSNLTSFDGMKPDIKNEAAASELKTVLESKQYSIAKIEEKAVKRNPSAPFTTSTLQQDAVRKLGFSAKKTMQVAQKLYEGASIGGTMTGLITYMRTDSTAISKEAIEGARAYIQEAFGAEYVPASARIYKTKTKNAQEAHEAIRPTSFDRPPEKVRQYISSDEFALYELIWKRAVASQMENAIVDQMSVEIVSHDGAAMFKATGSVVAFRGFLRVYVEATDEPDGDKKWNDKKLPKLHEGEKLDLSEITVDQHFTQPPARFNEASLVKKLEELGIGRPSTYATIINVLQERRYVSLARRTFVPEGTGYLVTSFLRQFFSKYVQYEFTADLEEELDSISNGALFWENVLNKFWIEFQQVIQQASDLSITEVIKSVENDLSDYVFAGLDEARKCPACGAGKLSLKLGRLGAFLGCSGYPECRYVGLIGAKPGGDGGAQGIGLGASGNVEVGVDANNGNDKVFLKKGPFGFYFEWENTKVEDAKKKGKKPKRLSVPKFISDPLELTIDDVATLDNLPKVLGAHPKGGGKIHLSIGRFGPFLKCKDKSYKVQKDISFVRLTLDEAIKIINQSGD